MVGAAMVGVAVPVGASSRGLNRPRLPRHDLDHSLPSVQDLLAAAPRCEIQKQQQPQQQQQQ